MKGYTKDADPGYEVVPKSNPSAQTIPLNVLGERTQIRFDFNGLEMRWHPVDSMRLSLWAATQGKQEALVEEISQRPGAPAAVCCGRT